MSMTAAPVERHIHMDLDLDPEHNFHYRSLGGDGRRIVLHRGDRITFTCRDEFCIRFTGTSPFLEEVLPSHHLFITSRVRDDASNGTYPYVVEIVSGDRILMDSASQGQAGGCPEIVIAAAD